MLYVVGKVVDLEYSLRALAKATEKATFGISMAKRVAAAKGEMKKIAAAVPKQELQDVVAAADGVALKLNNEANVMAAVEKISAAGKKISETYKGADLGRSRSHDSACQRLQGSGFPSLAEDAAI